MFPAFNQQVLNKMQQQAKEQAKKDNVMQIQAQQLQQLYQLQQQPQQPQVQCKCEEVKQQLTEQFEQQLAQLKEEMFQQQKQAWMEYESNFNLKNFLTLQIFNIKSENSGDVHKDYNFLNCIGQGSFGKVHKVQSKSDNQIYACKEIDYTKMQSKEKQLLDHECKLMKAMHHNHIVKYYDTYTDKLRCKMYIIMQYCENADLQKYIKRHKQERAYVNEDKIWSVLVQLIDALKYCHVDYYKENGIKILHRDLKPGNIFLTKDGSVVLGDFGLSKSLEGTNVCAVSSVGTPLYMAPEVLQKKPYSEKADIWSAACCIYELAALVPPYQASNMESLKIKVRSGVRPPLPSCYSQQLRQILDSMLQLDANKRASVMDLIKNQKVIKMAELMQEKQLAGAPRKNFGEKEQQVEDQPIQVAHQKDKLEEEMNKLVDVLKPKQQRKHLTEEELIQWEQRLDAKEKALNEREKQLDLRERKVKYY